VINMAVITKLVKGFDPDYPFKQQGRWSGDYFDVKGEPRGRWWGSGAAALGLGPGSEIDRDTHRQVIADHIDPRDGTTRLGRSPGNAAARAEALYQAKLEAEPHATLKRQFELRRQAAKEARQGPVYLELDNSISKSISVFYASIGESARSARLAGDQDAREYRAGLLREFDEMIYAANQAGLDYFEREAGFTRSGYHGRRVDGQESGHFDKARLVMEQFLQHTSRSDDVHLHVHNLIATIAKTIMDGKWRTPDSYGYNEVFPAVSAIVSLHLESALRRRFGVRWTPRGCQCAHGKCTDPAQCASNFGCEIEGILRSDIDCFSTRRQSVDEQLRKDAAEFERKNGRPPSERELFQMHQEAWDSTRKLKPEGAIDFDALHSGWAEQLRACGRELESVAPDVWDEAVVRSGSRSYGGGAQAQLDPAMLRRTALKALARCQSRQPKWSRYDLIHELGSVMPPEVRDLAPERMLPLLEDLADRMLAGEFAEVCCLEAPELVGVPERLRRSDGRPVYRRHMGAKYATAAHLSLEEQLLADAGREREPLVERERAAQLLGSDSATLAAQLERKPEAGSEETTSTGLRLDQAAAIWAALTNRQTSTTLTGPAGSGKTYTLAAAAKVAQLACPDRHVYAIAPSQAATNVLAAKLAEMGVRATVLNSTQFLDRVRRPVTDPVHLAIAPGSLFLTDEASMLAAGHATAVKHLVARSGGKEISAGDQEQLQPVTEGGAMGLQARKQGYLQLAEPVRFTRRWERDATLRLRAGDTTIADAYDEQGRIIGGTPEETTEKAAQMTATLLADGQDVILMARAGEHVRELSRRVRDELIRLGLVDRGRMVSLAEGARASVHDLVVNRVNDHKAGLANGDIVRVETIEDDGTVTVRKATGRDPQTGAPVFSLRAITRGSLKDFDAAYARTAHTAQGGQGTTGIALVTGSEDRQWLYPAMTRGTDANYALVMTHSPRVSDPAAGPEGAPELARFDRLERERAGLPPLAEELPAPDQREPSAVLADVIGRDGTELSATEYREEQLANADHLGLLEPMWEDAIGRARTGRYRQMLAEVLPPEFAAGAAAAPMATWLWRTLTAAEAAGLDAREELQKAVDSRPLTGAEYVAAVVDARLRKQIDVDHLVPLPEGRFADQVPQVGDPAEQKYLSQLAAAMDGRVERLGPFVAAQRPQWVIEAFGEVPDDPEARAELECRAGQVEKYRERYWDHPAEPIGPEPTMATPSKRAAWHAAAEALGHPANGPDVRGRDTGSLWLIRDRYEAETAWAPRFVSPELRSMRISARESELTRARAAAEARAAEAAGDQVAADRQQRLAASSVSMRSWYETRVAELEQADADYRDWEHATEGSRALAVAADAELRRREPGMGLAPLKTAEPSPVTEAERAELHSPPEADAAVGRVPSQAERDLAASYERYAGELATIERARSTAPGWVRELEETRPAFREQLADLQSRRIPDPDPEYGDQGPAWPAIGPRERDAIRQPPAAQMPPAPGVTREAEPEAGA
jgi:TrwC relaxase/AAA domain